MNVLEQVIENRYALYNGDSCEIAKAIPDNSIHYTIFSPPFASLYTYSNSDRDMGNSTGMRFQDRYKSGDNWYTKLEQHSFRTAKVRYEESGEYEDVTFYLIQNRAYISNNEAEIGKPIDLSMTKWSMLQPDVTLTKKNGENIDSMLFGVFAMPNANDLDLDSPYGMSLFSEAVEELKDLDIAYSRFTGEIKDSQDIELLGETMLQEPGRKINAPSDIKLPHHVTGTLH